MPGGSTFRLSKLSVRPHVQGLSDPLSCWSAFNERSENFSLLPTLAVMAVLAGVSLVILGSLTGSSSTGSSSTCFLWPIPPIIACGFSSSSGQGLAFPALVSVVLMIIFGLFLGTLQWRRSDGELDA